MGRKRLRYTLDELCRACGCCIDIRGADYVCTHSDNGEIGYDDRYPEFGKCFSTACPIAYEISRSGSSFSGDWTMHLNDDIVLPIKTEEIRLAEIESLEKKLDDAPATDGDGSEK